MAGTTQHQREVERIEYPQDLAQAQVADIAAFESGDGLARQPGGGGELGLGMTPFAARQCHLVAEFT